MLAEYEANQYQRDRATDYPSWQDQMDLLYHGGVDALKAEWDAQQYARTRRPLYPDIGDQLDDLYKKGAFSDEMAAKIKKVKDDNPKPS